MAGQGNGWQWFWMLVGGWLMVSGWLAAPVGAQGQLMFTADTRTVSDLFYLEIATGGGLQQTLALYHRNEACPDCACQPNLFTVQLLGADTEYQGDQTLLFGGSQFGGMPQLPLFAG